MQTHIVGDQCSVINDHNIPLNVYGYDPKVGSKCACIVHATVVYDQHEMGQIFFLINQSGNWDEGSWSSPSLPHVMMHELCYDQWSLQVSDTCFQKTMHSIKVWTLSMPPTQLFKVRKPTWEEYEDQNMLLHGIHSTLSLVGKSRVWLTI